jgi:hypothetical protein
LPAIHLKQKIYVPMITEVLTMEESRTYETSVPKPGNMLMPIQSVMTE